MNNLDEFRNISSGRKRLAELRERRVSAAEAIRNSRTTVLINLFIEIASGLIFGVGVIYAVKFLNLRRPYMAPLQYRIFIGTFGVITLAWYVYLVNKVRSNVKRLRELSSLAEH